MNFIYRAARSSRRLFSTTEVPKIIPTIFKRENVPPAALIVGLCALSFQIGVLYPWHEVLSVQFNELEVSPYLTFFSYLIDLL